MSRGGSPNGAGRATDASAGRRGRDRTGDGADRTADGRRPDGGETSTDGGVNGDTGATDGDDESGPPARVEMVVIAVSTLFTLALFAYVLWQATLGSTAVAPAAHVVDTTRLPGGDVQVEVAVENDRGRGLETVTVAVHCTSPPAEMTFDHVPVDGRRIGFVVCPPGTGTPEVTVTGWQEA